MWGKQRKAVILSLLLFLLISQTIVVVCDIPLDANFECSPISPNYENSIIFTQILINVTFDSSMAHFTALYTFKNSNTSSTEITIQLPFKDYEGPEDLILQRNSTDLEYKYGKTINIQLGESSWQTEQFRTLEFTLSFASEEKIKVDVQYSRPYIIFDYYTIPEAVHYNYRYCVGTARAWDHPLESVFFEFWIPKDICDDSYIAGYPDVVTREVALYYVLSLESLNWIPAEHDYWIGVLWTKDKPFFRSSDFTSKSTEPTISSGVGSLFMTSFGFEPILHVVVFSILVIYTKRRK